MKYRRPLSIVCLLFICSIALFLKTASPTVYTGDSGELSAAIDILGVAHPTGFPLYLTLGKLVTLALPFGNIAFKTNLLSGLAASLAICLAFGIILILTGRSAPSLFGALCLAFAATFRLQATIARVYTLSLAMILAVVLCGLLFYRTWRWKWLFMAGFLIGLGFGVHFQVVLTLPTMIILTTLAIRKGATWDLSKVAVVGLALCMGLTVLVYMPVRAATDTQLNWSTPRTWTEFKDYITQRSYSTKMFDRSFGDVVEVMKRVGLLFSKEFTLFLFPIIFIGLALAIRDRPLESVSILLIGLGNVFMMIAYGNRADIGYIHRYFLPVYGVFAVFIGYGAGCFYFHLKKITNFASLLIVGISILPFISSYHHGNRREMYLPFDFGRNMLKSMEQSSLMFAEGDNITFILFYLTESERYRSDLVILDKQMAFWPQRSKGLPNVPWQQLEVMLSKQYAYDVYFSVVGTLVTMERVKPVGYLYKVIREPGDAQDYSWMWERFEHRGLNEVRVATDFTSQDLVIRYYFHQAEIYRDREELDKAREYYLQASRMAIDAPDQHNNLGNLLGQLGFYEDALKEYDITLYYRPGDPETLSNMGVVYSKMGRYEKAEEILRAAIKTAPYQGTLYINLGSVLKEQGKFQEAYEAERTARRLLGQPEPKSMDERVMQAQYLIREGKLDEGEQVLSEFLKINPHNVQALFGLALIAERRGNFNQAAKRYEACLAVKPDIPGPMKNLAILYSQKLNQPEKALRLWEKYLELKPDDSNRSVIEKDMERLRVVVGE